jgi:SRSO17 transposase
VWEEAWGGLRRVFAGLFHRADALAVALDFVLALVVDQARKNCWTLAELAGHAGPGRFQHLLARARWSAADAKAALRDYAAESLGFDDVVLVVDETGDLKKGDKTVGVQRQYTGTAGRIENAQVTVHLAYATADAHMLVDAELYLPKSWAGDPGRRAGAGVPEDVRFSTKPALASAMIGRALDGGVVAAWVAGDEVYGADPALRRMLEERGVGYVLAVRRDWRIEPAGGGQARADQAARALPAGLWQELSAGAGSKGPRLYRWARIEIAAPPGSAAGWRWLLARRNHKTGEMAFYLCFSPAKARLGTLVRIAGRRWRVEESFQQSKELTGLDQHQVRRWDSHNRWVALVMWAYALLVAVTAAARARDPDHPGMVRHSVNEVRRLLTAGLPTRPPNQVMAWSHWRRRHQHRAQLSHYQHRSGAEIRL